MRASARAGRGSGRSAERMSSRGSERASGRPSGRGSGRGSLRASARLPWLAGPPVPFRGRRLLDATLAEAIPIHAAQTSATDLLVLQTRPHGVDHTPLSGGVAQLTDRYLDKVNPALVELRRRRSERYDQLSGELAERARNPLASPAVCVTWSVKRRNRWPSANTRKPLR